MLSMSFDNDECVSSVILMLRCGTLIDDWAYGRNPFKVAMEADRKAKGQNLLHQKLAAREQEVRQVQLYLGKVAESAVICSMGVTLGANWPASSQNSKGATRS